jgi:tetratricopeptide (TPR) repeat protein
MVGERIHDHSILGQAEWKRDRDSRSRRIAPAYVSRVSLPFSRTSPVNELEMSGWSSWTRRKKQSEAEKSNPSLKIASSGVTASPGSLPVAWVTYTAKGSNGLVYSVRAFVATGDICGDLEFYSAKPISADDADLKSILASYQLDERYTPKFADIFVYAQLLYKSKQYSAAAPMFEEALVRLKDEPSAATKDGKRVLVDQAGMAYGMSGEVGKARATFEKAVAEVPDYPLYYYNLACADAEENKLADARLHLQQAFARKANLIAGETMPEPTKDGSFLPHRDNQDFWTFLQSLRP